MPISYNCSFKKSKQLTLFIISLSGIAFLLICRAFVLAAFNSRVYYHYSDDDDDDDDDDYYYQYYIYHYLLSIFFSYETI